MAAASRKGWNGARCLVVLDEELPADGASDDFQQSSFAISKEVGAESRNRLSGDLGGEPGAQPEAGDARAKRQAHCSAGWARWGDPCSRPLHAGQPCTAAPARLCPLKARMPSPGRPRRRWWRMEPLNAMRRPQSASLHSTIAPPSRSSLDPAEPLSSISLARSLPLFFLSSSSPAHANSASSHPYRAPASALSARTTPIPTCICHPRAALEICRISLPAAPCAWRPRALFTIP